MGDVTVKGGERLRATLAEAAGGLQHLTNAEEAAADIILRRARSQAPQLTGRLARSLRARPPAVETTVPYGWPVHSGVPRHNQKPNPFLLRAAEATMSQWEDAYLTDIDRVLGEVRGA